MRFQQYRALSYLISANIRVSASILIISIQADMILLLRSNLASSIFENIVNQKKIISPTFYKNQGYECSQIFE